jgi:hypothetical protein
MQELQEIRQILQTHTILLDTLQRHILQGNNNHQTSETMKNDGHGTKDDQTSDCKKQTTKEDHLKAKNYNNSNKDESNKRSPSRRVAKRVQKKNKDYYYPVAKTTKCPTTTYGTCPLLSFTALTLFK